MTSLTPETLPRHELVGLFVEVVEATDPDLVGIDGRVQRETAQTLYVASADRVRQVPKAETTFVFALPDETASDRKVLGLTSDPAPAGDDVTYVTVDGSRLLSRPAERTETRGDTIWESD